MINDNADISILPISPRGPQRAHISPEEDWNFPCKNYYKNKAWGKVELLTVSVCLEYASSETNKTHGTKYSFLHICKLTKYLVSLAKSLPIQ